MLLPQLYAGCGEAPHVASALHTTTMALSQVVDETGNYVYGKLAALVEPQHATRSLRM